jgi:ribosomal protein L11 methyltransferase
VPLERSATEAEGWLARNLEEFPEQLIGRRFAVRGTHETAPPIAGRHTLTVDAGLAFGSGEHGSTRGCLRALEFVAHRRPRRILDLGTGSGILAMAAAKLLRRTVIATDIDPWSVRVTQQNAVLNGVSRLLRVSLADGWKTTATPAGAPYDLVFANILARPLCAMARPLAQHLAPGGRAILAGLLATQERMVLAAHRRQGLVLERRFPEGQWSALLLRKKG